MESEYDGITKEYVLDASELIGIKEHVTGFFKGWLEPGKSIQLDFMYKNKRYLIRDNKKFLDSVEKYELKADKVILSTVLPNIDGVLDALADLYKEHSKNFGNGRMESTLLDLDKLLSGFHLERGDLQSKSVKNLNESRKQLVDIATEIITKNNEKHQLSKNTNMSIKKIINDQDQVLYKKLLDILPKAYSVLDNSTETTFLSKITQLYEDLASNSSRALKVYVEHKGARDIKEIIENTISLYKENPYKYQNYITNLYNLFKHKLPYHTNYKGLERSAEEAIINFSTDLFELYSNIPEKISLKKDNFVFKDDIHFNDTDYNRLIGALQNTYDHFEFFLPLQTYSIY